MMFSGTIGTWIPLPQGDISFMGVTWTLAIELFATFLIYIVAYTTVNYDSRWMIYVVICLFTWVPQITDTYGYTKFDVA